eukprot:UN21675
MAEATIHFWLGIDNTNVFTCQNSLQDFLGHFTTFYQTSQQKVSFFLQNMFGVRVEVAWGLSKNEFGGEHTSVRNVTIGNLSNLDILFQADDPF